jgi:uncharacterized membrane protein YuzA (DUF378 family)
MIAVWSALATSPASLIVGVLTAAALIAKGRHKEEGKTSTDLIVSAFLFGVSVYTMTCLLVGHFALNAMARMIADGFGEARIAWVFVGLAADAAARLYRLFDP